jgi:hypothetical protein
MIGFELKIKNSLGCVRKDGTSFSRGLFRPPTFKDKISTFVLVKEFFRFVI